MPDTPQTSTMSTMDLASWVVGHGRDCGFSARARELAQLSVIDTIACMFAALIEPGPEILLGTLTVDSEAAASVIGLGTGAAAYDAALVNGTSAHMLDFDDGDMVSRGHPSCVVLPTVMALSEQSGASGAAMLDAFIAGWTVMQAIGSMVNPYMPRRGYHVTSAVGVVAAAAAGARLMNLTAKETATAIGIAASAGAGIRGNFGTDMKPYHAGCASAAAVRAVELAAAGFTASHSILEALDGFVSVLADPAAVAGVRTHVDRLLAGEIAFEREPPLIKFLPICHSTHSAVEAALKLRPALVGRLDSIRSITAEAGSHTAQYLIHHRPASGLEAKFSMEGAIAIALVDGDTGTARFTDESVRREEIQSLIRKVTYRTDSRYDDARFSRMQPGSITVETDEGEWHEEVLDPVGGRARPADLAQILTKFTDHAKAILGEPSTAEAVRLFGTLGSLADVRRLGRVLRGKATSAGRNVGG